MEVLEKFIREKAEEELQTKVEFIEKLENVLNNTVYKIVSNNKPYIFKIYKQRNWPEDGKLQFINSKLIENSIGCSKLIIFDRTDVRFPTGYLIEEYLSGEPADRIVFDTKKETEFYEKLAHLVSRIHNILLENYGYIGNGVASHISFIDFIGDKYDEITSAIKKDELIKNISLEAIKKSVIDRLRLCENLPPVLNHGDISTKNVVVDLMGGLTIIDWDDATANNWLADISRMTYWMKFIYNEDEYALYRNSFLDNYTTNEINVFYEFENAFHVWIGLDYLNFHKNKPQYENTLKYFIETVEKLIS
jgi:Ser/Thr protein kinase RdoA (MazF antagonist)